MEGRLEMPEEDNSFLEMDIHLNLKRGKRAIEGLLKTI